MKGVFQPGSSNLWVFAFKHVILPVFAHSILEMPQGLGRPSLRL